MTELRSPLQAQVVQWLVAPGDAVRAGDVVVTLEAMAATLEIDAVIDPADTRAWLSRGLAASRMSNDLPRPLIDTW